MKLLTAFTVAILLLSAAAGGHPGVCPHCSNTAAPGPPVRDSRPLTVKYAGLLRTDETHVRSNLKLYSFIDDWLGTPYLWSGCSKSGIDCSCFVQTLFSEVFNIKIKRTSLAQFCDKDIALFKNREQYQLGDLIFFKTNIARETRYNRVTHVGFYLTNGYFVQSSGAGVNIASLDRGYWKTKVVAAGRLRNTYYKRAGIAIPGGEVDDAPKLDVDEDSTFKAVPFPEDMVYIIEQYSQIMNMHKDDISFPEVFDFVETNRYAPLNIMRSCTSREPGSNCLARTLLKDVFAVELESPPATGFVRHNMLFQGDKPEVARFLDVIHIIPQAGKKKEMIAGVYLYNGFFLHFYKNDLSIYNLQDSAFLNSGFEVWRFKPDITRAAYSNIMEKRKAPKLPPDAVPPAVPDTLRGGGSPQVLPAVVPGADVNVPPPGKRKKKRRT